jgi:hypothetical protein
VNECSTVTVPAGVILKAVPVLNAPLNRAVP